MKENRNFKIMNVSVALNHHTRYTLASRHPFPYTSRTTHTLSRNNICLRIGYTRLFARVYTCVHTYVYTHTHIYRWLRFMIICYLISILDYWTLSGCVCVCECTYTASLSIYIYIYI